MAYLLLCMLLKTHIISHLVHLGHSKTGVLAFPTPAHTLEAVATTYHLPHTHLTITNSYPKIVAFLAFSGYCVYIQLVPVGHFGYILAYLVHFARVT